MFKGFLISPGPRLVIRRTIKNNVTGFPLEARGNDEQEHFMAELFWRRNAFGTCAHWNQWA